MVRASIIGAILENLLLALGLAFLLGGLRYHDQEYNVRATRVYSTMMLLAVRSLMIPSAFSRFFSADTPVLEEFYLNVGLAVVLLLIYLLYLVFMLKTHPEFFASAGGTEHHHSDSVPWRVPRAVGSLVAASVLAAWMSEILVGAG